MKVILNILQTPYDLECSPDLEVKLCNELNEYSLVYKDGVYSGEVPKGKYKLIVNDVWNNEIYYYYLSGEVAGERIKAKL